MKSLHFTAAHIRALEWLPTDGTWRLKPDLSIAPALHSLVLYHSNLAVSENGTFGPRGGYCSRFRLTPLGVEEKMRRATAKAD